MVNKKIQKKLQRKFFWIIIICSVAIAAGLGYKKHSEYQKKFEKIALKGTMSQYTMDYYSGNVKSDSLSQRSQTLIAAMTSKKTYDELVRISGYNIDYDAFLQVVVCDNDGTKEVVVAKFQYPWGMGGFEVLDDNEAKQFLSYYQQAVKTVCDELMGPDTVKLLGTSDVGTYTYEANAEQKSTALKAVVKNVFIGAIIGAIIPIVLITLFYLLNGKLRTAQEISYCSGLKLLAKIKSNDMKDIANAALYLDYVRNEKPVNVNLMCVGECDAKPIKDELLKCFENENINVTSGKIEKGNTDCYKSALKLMSDKEVYAANILVVQAGKIKEDELEEVTCEMSLFDIKGTGVIVYELG